MDYMLHCSIEIVLLALLILMWLVAAERHGEGVDSRR